MIKDNLVKIQKQIDDALAKRKSRMLTCEKVQLVAVSKTHPAETVKEAVAAGLTVFGENKVQEAAEKIPLVGAGEWHLIGHLQKNKVKKAVNLFSLIYSVDSKDLLLAIDKEAEKINKIQDILLQVNVAEEKSKFGLSLPEFSEITDTVDRANNIRLRGLMVIAPEVDNAEEIRPVFATSYKLFCELKEKYALIDTLSMGMSSDFQVAIQEGANNIRLGTMIFGKRDYSI